NDFAEFAELCTLDTASRGKTVSLECDIDFGSTDFSPVPTFGGRFNGNGYTISGIRFERDGSRIGLFRYVQEGAIISSLKVKGNITPGGTKSHVGGIAGENSGTIENCTFEGNIKGENLVGGIAGLNLENGRIISSISFGSIIGENSTGGIVGKNEGLLQDCTNNTDINTSYEEKKKDLSEMDIEADAPLENYKTEKEENEEESVLGHTDTGGITGYNSGIIKGCVNNASVGYQHVGYNVGGISGRQSGYILGCVNNGFVQGRKDVGGISGQAEPYLLLQPSENSMQNIQSELDKLHTMVDRLVSDTDNLGDESRKDFDSIIARAENAKSSAKSLIDRGTDFADDNLSQINAQAAVL
ncbi:MAG: GLUG motif-containing protein, partial [Clostridia bacterium]|nr:GLUG motif-containing protein [Clostridia bacterium]